MIGQVRAPALRLVDREAGDNEARLVDGLRVGNLEALGRAYDQWHQRVRVLARRLLSDDAAAEDVVQEVFAALPRSARRYRGEVGLEAFLLAIAVKRARHHQRAALRRRSALDRWGGDGRRAAGDAGDPERDAYRRQLGLRLASALDRLSHVQRVAFVLCEVEGMTSAEAAAIAAVPEATVRTRIFHARRKLRGWLALEHDE